MGSLNSASLVDKLSKLNSTQASIETLSEWCNFYRREAGRIVGIWDEEFNKATPAKRLVLLYLANDILQNSRKKGPEYVVEFFKVLPRDLKLAIQSGDEKTKDKVGRLVAVMEERKVFGASGSKILKDLLTAAAASAKKLSARTGAAPAPNGAHHPGDAVGRSTPAELEPLARAVTGSNAAAALVGQLDARCSAVLQKDLFEKGSEEDVAAACALLDDFSGALSGEVQQRDALVLLLAALAAAQAEAKQQLQERQKLCQRQQQQFSGRLAQLRVAAGASGFSPEASAAAPAAGGFSAPAFTAAGLASPAADMEVDAPPDAAHPGVPRTSSSSGGGGGADDEMKAAAAALVAQLTASGDPKAILEAMAALPQDQQLEIHEQLMQHMGGGGGEGGSDTATAADYSADGTPAEDEYNPDEPPFL